MAKTTRSQIVETTKILFSEYGYEGFSMRALGQQSGIGISSLYHFYDSKDDLLRDTYHHVNTKLGVSRALLPLNKSAKEMLLDRILFQFKNMTEVMFILKYYLHFRSSFQKDSLGYAPEKAYIHITEVIELGVKTNEFNVAPVDILRTSKAIAHTINGFVMEYFPEKLSSSELNPLANNLHSFLLGSLLRT